MTSNDLHRILFQWTGHHSFDSIPTSELENWVLQHPYSPSLQLLLTKKYGLEGSTLYADQLQKTAVYFPNALQLHQWLEPSEGLNNAETIVQAQADAKLTSILTEQLAQFKESDGQEALVFEQELTPLQKDYFAAQGIEIDLSKIPQDKFTTQLRSFTAWLKVLKQQETHPSLEEMGEEQEKAIAEIAEKANKTEDVITEAMAEIWEKQGNFKKAIAIYSKLSFIFPEKSVYFASRIEHLKQKK
jgi:hypothetical protein